MGAKPRQSFIWPPMSIGRLLFASPKRRTRPKGDYLLWRQSTRVISRKQEGSWRQRGRKGERSGVRELKGAALSHLTVP